MVFGRCFQEGDTVKMRILDRYIGLTVASHTLVVMSVFIALFSFASFVGEIDYIGKGKYGALQAVYYVALTLPSLIYQLFPPVALIGSMVGLGMLSSGSELTAIRAAGVSMGRIILSVMKVGVLLMVAALIVGEWLAPQAEYYGQTMRSTALAERISLKTQSGFWVRDGHNFIHVREILADSQLVDISIYEFAEQNRLQKVTHARTASYQQNKWQLQDIEYSQINTAGIITQRQPSAEWGSLLSPAVLGVVAVKPDKLSLTGLRKYIGYLHDNNLNADRYELAFWKKIMLPLGTGVMVFLAIPFIFGTLRSVGIGQRIMVGTLLGIAFYLFNQTFGYVGLVYGMNPVASAMLPPALFLGLGLFLMRRVH